MDITFVRTLTLDDICLEWIDVYKMMNSKLFDWSSL